LVAALEAFGELLFIPAGRLDWVAGWLYFGITVVNMAINYAFLRHWNPELLERRPNQLKEHDPCLYVDHTRF
jgi:hypothetical protein